MSRRKKRGEDEGQICDERGSKRMMMMTRIRKWSHGRNSWKKQWRMVVNRIRNWWKGSGNQTRTFLRHFNLRQI
jgi:hypothetical protein